MAVGEAAGVVPGEVADGAPGTPVSCRPPGRGEALGLLRGKAGLGEVSDGDATAGEVTDGNATPGEPERGELAPGEVTEGLGEVPAGQRLQVTAQ